MISIFQLAIMDATYTGLGITCGCVLGGKAIAKLGGVAPTFTLAGTYLIPAACFTFHLMNNSTSSIPRIKQK